MSAAPPEASGDTTAAISDAIVAVLRAHTGKGPSEAKTAMTSDVAVVTFRDCLTPAEKTLLGEGNAALVMQGRSALHEGMRAEAAAAVEAITGRHVAAYLTDQQHDPDIAVLVFVFGPVQDLEGT